VSINLNRIQAGLDVDNNALPPVAMPTIVLQNIFPRTPLFVQLIFRTNSTQILQACSYISAPQSNGVWAVPQKRFFLKRFDSEPVEVFDLTESIELLFGEIRVGMVFFLSIELISPTTGQRGVTRVTRFVISA